MPTESLQDESINLMTGCQLAGFRHTVGSLWDVYDDYSVIAAREFYRALRDYQSINDRAVAWGVHSASKHIREMIKNGKPSRPEETSPLAWASYIHIGPYVIFFVAMKSICVTEY